MENINQEVMSPAVVDDQVPARSTSPARSTPPPTPDAPAKRKNMWSVRHSRISNVGAMNPKPVPVSIFPRFLDLFGVGRQEEEEEQQPMRGQKKREPGTYNDPRDYTNSRLPYFYALAPKKYRKDKAVVLSKRLPTGIPKPYFYKASPCRELLELFELILVQEEEQKARQQEEEQKARQQEEEQKARQQEEEQKARQQEELQLAQEHQEEEFQLEEEELLEEEQQEEELPEEEEEEELPEEEEEEEEELPEEEEEEEELPEEEEQEEEQPEEEEVQPEEEEEDDEEEEPEWAWELLQWELPQQHLQEPQGAAAAPKNPPPRQHRIRAVPRRHNGSMPVRKGLF